MTPAEIHRWARPLYLQGFREHYERDPSLPEVQAIQGVGWLETRQTTAWTGAGQGSFNAGAIQGGGKPPCPIATSFQYTDTHPNPDGTSTPYSICFRRYASAELGMADLIRVGYVRRPRVLAAATRGNFYEVSAELHASRYYEGFGATVAARIANHHKALASAIKSAALAIGESFNDVPPIQVPPWQDDFLPDNPMILRGSRGPYVKVWQDILNGWLEKNGANAIVGDSMFGPVTAVITKNWQLSKQLKGDSKVGPLTWAKAAEAA